MKLKISVPFDVEVDTIQQRKITLDYLYQKFNWEDSYYIRDEHVLKKHIVNHPEQTWQEEVIVRNATDDDYTIAYILNKLNYETDISRNL